jgi:predicted MFS family arabinose efflux permease
VVAQHYGWRAAFLVAGIPGLILTAFLLRVADPERGALDAVKENVHLEAFGARAAAAFRNRVWLACTASYVAYTFAMGAFATWAPAYSSVASTWISAPPAPPSAPSEHRRDKGPG